MLNKKAIASEVLTYILWAIFLALGVIAITFILKKLFP